MAAAEFSKFAGILSASSFRIGNNSTRIPSPLLALFVVMQWPQDWKRSVFIPIPKKGNAKECSHYHTIALISHASKVLLKILQARLQQYVNQELQMFKLVLEKAEEPEIKLPTSIGSSKSKRVPEKHLLLLY